MRCQHLGKTGGSYFTGACPALFHNRRLPSFRHFLPQLVQGWRCASEQIDRAGVAMLKKFLGRPVIVADSSLMRLNCRHMPDGWSVRWLPVFFGLGVSAPA